MVPWVSMVSEEYSPGLWVTSSWEFRKREFWAMTKIKWLWWYTTLPFLDPKYQLLWVHPSSSRSPMWSKKVKSMSCKLPWMDWGWPSCWNANQQNFWLREKLPCTKHLIWPIWRRIKMTKKEEIDTFFQNNTWLNKNHVPWKQHACHDSSPERRSWTPLASQSECGEHLR